MALVDNTIIALLATAVVLLGAFWFIIVRMYRDLAAVQDERLQAVLSRIEADRENRD